MTLRDLPVTHLMKRAVSLALTEGEEIVSLDKKRRDHWWIFLAADNISAWSVANCTIDDETKSTPDFGCLTNVSTPILRFEQKTKNTTDNFSLTGLSKLDKNSYSVA